MQKKAHRNIGEQLLFMFFIFLTGAVIGWLYEVVLHLVQEGFFVNRGMLRGPWLPIYGVGAFLIAILKRYTGRRPVLFFGVSVGACAVLEYATSWIMEVIYHTRWWDYSNLPLNLHGRIFLGGLLGFGAAGIFFAYVLLPMLQRAYQKIPQNLVRWILLAILVIFALDCVISLANPNTGVGITTVVESLGRLIC